MMVNRERRMHLAVLALMLVLAAAGIAVAAEEPADEAASIDEAAAGDEAPAGKEMSLWTMIKYGGTVGAVIILMSVAAMAFVVEHFISIRRERLIPPHMVAELERYIAAKRYADAQKLCEQDGSFIARVIGAGLSQVGGMFGFFDIQSAMQEASEQQVSQLYRKLEYLTFIAATAPMLGLLGTVTGMINAFNVIAAKEGAAKPSELASGISEALITTAEGLIVAIPVMFFVAFFRNRIDSTVGEAETIVEKLMGPFRRQGTP